MTGLYDPEGNSLAYVAERDDPEYGMSPYDDTHHASEAASAAVSTNGRDPQTTEEPPVLPEEFWTARTTLGHIRTAARSRGAAPDAVLGAVLAGTALRTPPEVVLPPIIGGVGSLNLAVGIIGASGTGKGVAMRGGEDLLPDRPGWAGVGPLGTGQGMTEVYFERVKTDDGEWEHRRRLDGFMFEADEGQVLSKLGEGTGSITLETLRQSFNGERCGTTTVGAPWRVLQRQSYRMCHVLGFQPIIARPLLADTAGGTPQRFLWFGVVDPDAPAVPPEHPGPLKWRGPETSAGKQRPVRVAASVVAEVRARRHEVLTGQRVPGVYESHRDLLRLKVAVLLGVLEGRETLTVDDWALAAMVLDTSDAVREATLRRNRAADAVVEAERNVKAANRAAVEEGARRNVGATIERVARVIARKVDRECLDPTVTLSRRDLRNAVSSDDRQWFAEALGHAEAMGWVIETDHGTYTRGDA